MSTHLSPSIDIAELQKWIGKTEMQSDLIPPSCVSQWRATIDNDKEAHCDQLPLLAHWMLFTPQARQAGLNADGHPKLGGFLPPVPLPRRMWAGGQVRFHKSLPIGQNIHRETTINNIVFKEGRQGQLVFLTLLHRISTGDSVAIEEQQDIVYRAPSSPMQPGERPSGPPFEGPKPEWERTLTPDETMLFRYSALTFNAHRIHYDRRYAQQEEGYPELVVQGPLTATLLMDSAISWFDRSPSLFTFRGLSPLFVNDPIRLCARREGDTLNLWALAPGDRIGMTATVDYTDDSDG